LLCIFKLATFRQRQKIESRSSKLASVVDRVFDATAALDHLISQKPHTDHVIVTDTISHLSIDFERQAHTILSRASVSVCAIILRAQKPGHCVSVCVVKLNSIKPG